MKEILPVVCSGYHFSHYHNDNIDNIEEVSIPYSTSDVYIKEGWTTTRNARFSPTGEVVSLCPECSKRWAAERAGIIAHLIDAKIAIFNRYMNSPSAMERSKLVAVDLYILRREFERYEPTDYEWSMWNKI